MSGVQKSSGEENLRADAKVNSAEHTRPASAPQISVDIPKGVSQHRDDDNMRADHQEKKGSWKEVPPASGKDMRPAGVQHFNGGSV